MKPLTDKELTALHKRERWRRLPIGDGYYFLLAGDTGAWIIEKCWMGPIQHQRRYWNLRFHRYGGTDSPRGTFERLKDAKDHVRYSEEGT